jgi:hypothetical protein
MKNEASRGRVCEPSAFGLVDEAAIDDGIERLASRVAHR